MFLGDDSWGVSAFREHFCLEKLSVWHVVAAILTHFVSVFRAYEIGCN
jgi:hypothetical protein